MKKTLIFRIENKDGTGYFNGCICEQQMKGLYKAINPPSLDNGINRNINEDEKCGFLNESQMYSALHRNDLKMLRRHGFDIRRKYVECSAIGREQVLYKE